MFELKGMTDRQVLQNITVSSALCRKVNVEKIVLLNRCSLMQTYFRNENENHAVLYYENEN